MNNMYKDAAYLAIGFILLIPIVYIGGALLIAAPFVGVGYLVLAIYTNQKRKAAEQKERQELEEKINQDDEINTAGIIAATEDYIENPDYFKPVVQTACQMVAFERPPPRPDSIYALRRHAKKYENYEDQSAYSMANIIVELGDILNNLPPQPPGFLTLKSKLKDHIDVKSTIDHLSHSFFKQNLLDVNAFQITRDLLERNLHTVSRVPYGKDGNMIYSTDFKGTDQEAIDKYFKGLPIKNIFDIPIDVTVPEKTRFEHSWIVGSTGTGKTTLLKEFLLNDFEKVARGECSVVLMDAKGSLIPQLTKLKVFARGQPLHDKLVLIDATDNEYPVQINPFRGIDRTLTASERTQMQNTTVDFLTYLIEAVLGADMTGKQATLFRYVVRLLMVVDNANIYTFERLFNDDTKQKFEPYLNRLPDTVRNFFETQFWPPPRGRDEFRSTRSEVLRRIWTVLENETLTNMMTAPVAKLDMYKEMNAGKVILVDARRGFLGDRGVMIFGRTILSQIALAIEKRSFSDDFKLPCHVYVDEAADYLSEPDKRITYILEQAREQRVSMTIAHQRLSQIDRSTVDSLHANTAIKIINTNSPQDASSLARAMRCDPEFLSQPKLSFAVYAKDTTKNAMTYSTNYGRLESLDVMSDMDFADIRQDIRDRYAIHISQLVASIQQANDTRDPPEDHIKTEASDW